MKTLRLPLSVKHLTALTSLAAYFFVATAATAAQSEWVSSEGGAIRIVASGRQADGTIPAILEIRLKPGWKTYWLEPGASGIPPQVTLDPAEGITFSGLRFPAPKSFDDGDVHYTGYDRSVAFPMSLKSEKMGPLSLKASVFLGICKDICIPVQADISLSLAEGVTENPLEKARIADAVAALPSAPSDTFKVAAASYDTAARRLRVTLVVPDLSKEAPLEFFLAGPPGYGFGKPENIMISNGQVTTEWPVRPPAKESMLKSGSTLLVARSGNRSIQTTLAFD